MRRLPQFAWLIAFVGVNMVSSIHAESLTAVPFQDVKITDGFWGRRIHTNRTATIEANLHQCEITGRIRNFAIAGKLEEGKHRGLLYDDSDVYKVLEGIAYTLSSVRNVQLKKRADAIIDKIAAAQQPDGYLNTYYTLVKPKERWKNIQHGHELYCAGHLIEAAVAYHQATDKRKLLDVAVRLADHIDRTFGPGKNVDTSGHEEIELALVKLYQATKQERYLKLAQFFLDTRGRKDDRRLFGEYAQDDKPIREQKEVAGHAVRAMYLYCGMADVAGLTGDKTLLDALTTLWHDVVERKMYVTGGIGPSANNEGFTVPYDLPNDSAYAETCAAIGMALWNHRMFLLSGDGKYADVLEREVYNGLLSGVSLTGDRFFYVNPLGSRSQHHRAPWFDCSCCPTNIVRYIPGMGERVWAHRDNAVWSVLYMANTATVSLKDGKVRLIEKTNYPWEGDIEIAVKPEKRFEFAIHLRIPGWCRVKPVVSVNGEKMTAEVEHGYVRLVRTWKQGDVIRLFLPMVAERVHADPRVQANRGRVALQRGPVLYCLEGVDNGGKARSLCLPKEAKLSANLDKDLLGGVVVLRGEALAVSRPEEKLEIKKVTFKAVPYFAWDNRQPGQMIVWIAEEPERAELPVEDGVIVEGVRIRASYFHPADTLETLLEDSLPKSSKDQSIRRITWWDHRGSVEWMSYRTSKPRNLSGASVYWFDDTGVGACRVPAEWRLLWLDGDEWKPVKLLKDEQYGTLVDQLNTVSFEPVTTRELRLEVRLKAGFSGGVLRWRVREVQ
ncbi:MAG TPA: beta-L-arabinofuranosidase domain-containing protein [Gemmataceae bacterium]|nr:beta-L-arabinofuranosidase domain-containing protein [Gemmataceae bacterium]